MLTIILFGFLGLVIGIVLDLFVFEYVDVKILFMCGFMMIGVFIAGIVGASLDYDIKTETEYIYSLKDSSSVDGDFFLGTGSVDDELEYRFFIKQEDGSLTFDSVKSDKVQIKFDDLPRIEKYENVSKYYYWVIVPPCEKKDTLFIPKESVIQNISVDLE